MKSFLSLSISQRPSLDSMKRLLIDIQKDLIGKPYTLQFNSLDQLEISWNGPREVEGQSDSNQRERPFSIDFSSRKMSGRGESAKSELIFKATGFNSSPKPWIVWDLTAGIGRDSFVLAQAGCEVTMFERNQVLYFLLLDATRRAPELPMNLFHLDSTTIFSYIDRINDGINQPDVVYLDPMYSQPPIKRKSKSRKETQILQRLTESDQVDQLNDDTLLQTALKIAKKRVLVKRSIHASPLSHLIPQASFKGTTQRFDVYLPSLQSSF